MAKYKKYESEFKLKLVKEHRIGQSIKALSKQWGISYSQIRKWVDHYNLSGSEGLLRKSNRNYTKGFKLKVVQAYLKKDLSLRDCCLHFQIPTIGTVSAWVKVYERLGEDGLNTQQKGRKKMKENKAQKSSKPLTRLEELEQENLYLRAENELLKKLEALSQGKTTPQKKKRWPLKS